MPIKKKSDINAVFVYGTLKVGGHFSVHFDRFRSSAEVATISGEMYNITNGFFPGVILNDKGVVTGELHRYKSIDSVLKTLDHIEGYYGPGKNNLYNRVTVEVTIKETGEKINAWVYVFAQDLTNCKKMEVGEWPLNIKEIS